MPHPIPRCSALIAAGVVLSFAAGPAGAQRGAQVVPQPGQPPLASFAAERIVVMPVQLYRADSTAWVPGTQWATWRKEVDDSVGAALSDRGLGKKWAYAADVVRMAKRNVPYASDPYTLGAQPLRGRQLKPDDQVPPLMVSNMRSLIALGDARYTLVPLEMAFVKRPEGTRLVVRLVLIDGRTGRFLWEGEAASEPANAMSPVMVSSMAQRVADLVVAR